MIVFKGDVVEVLFNSQRGKRERVWRRGDDYIDVDGERERERVRERENRVRSVSFSNICFKTTVYTPHMSSLEICTPPSVSPRPSIVTRYKVISFINRNNYDKVKQVISG